MSARYADVGHGGGPGGSGRRSILRRPSYATVAAGTAAAGTGSLRSTGPEGLPEQDTHMTGGLGLDGEMGGEAGILGRRVWSEQLRKYVDGLGCKTHDDHPPFFTPSYLKRSRHVAQLEKKYNEHVRDLEEHARLLHQQQPQPRVKDLDSDSVYNGVAQHVVERLSPTSETNKSHPLPTRWNSNDKQSGMDVLDDGTELRFNGTTRSNDEAAAVRTDFPMPKECGIYYFEVTVLSKGRDGLIGVGFSTNKVSLNRLPGWEQESWAYHGDDGFSFACHASGKAYGPKFSALDVIGCGINFRTGNAFFTKNGVDLGTAFTGIKTDKLYPSVGMKKRGEHLRANFGKHPFCFDIDGYMAKERSKVFFMMQSADVGSLHPPDDESSLTQKLVAQYLVHEGYVETARTFAADCREEQQTLPGRPAGQAEAVSFFRDEDDVHAINRQKIRKAILNGDIDKALKYTTSYYPNLLDDERNRGVNFQLRCRKFIEMMRTYTEMVAKQQHAGNSNGHSDGGLAQEAEGEDQDQQMDVDDQLHRETSHHSSTSNSNSISDDEADEASDSDDVMQTSTPNLNKRKRSSPSSATSLLRATLAYGRDLQSLFHPPPSSSSPSSPSPPDNQLHTTIPRNISEAESQHLQSLFALLAYRDPFNSVLAPLLSIEGRIALGERVNAAVLSGMGMPSAAALEVLAGTTEVLLGFAGQKGGAGAVVGVGGDILGCGERG